MTQIKRIIGPYEERQAVCRDYDPRTAEVAQQVAARFLPPPALTCLIGSNCRKCGVSLAPASLAFIPPGRLPGSPCHHSSPADLAFKRV
jgi:hypothetical protein